MGFGWRSAWLLALRRAAPANATSTATTGAGESIGFLVFAQFFISCLFVEYRLIQQQCYLHRVLKVPRVLTKQHLLWFLPVDFESQEPCSIFQLSV